MFSVLALTEIKIIEKKYGQTSLNIEKFPNIIDPSVKIEDNVDFGCNIVYPFSVICSGTKLKTFVFDSFKYFSTQRHYQFIFNSGI